MRLTVVKFAQCDHGPSSLLLYMSFCLFVSWSLTRAGVRVTRTSVAVASRTGRATMCRWGIGTAAPALLLAAAASLATFPPGAILRPTTIDCKRQRCINMEASLCPTPSTKVKDIFLATARKILMSVGWLSCENMKEYRRPRTKWGS